jgi:hypothetical protein
LVLENKEQVCVLYVLSSRRADMSVAFVREESAAAAQEVSLPPRAKYAQGVHRARIA